MGDLVGVVWEEYEKSKRPQRTERTKGSGKDKSSSKGGGGKGKGDHSRTIKLKYCDPAFRLRGHLVGQGGQYVKHIQSECKCGVDIYDENEELRVNLTSDSQENLRKGESMLKDLIGVAYKKYDEWKKEKGMDDRDRGDRGSKGSKGKGKRDDRGRDD